MDLRELTTRLIHDVWNGDREQTAYDLVDPSHPGDTGDGPDGYLAWHRDRRAAFPDQRYEIIGLLADGDRVAVRWRGTGTQHGSFGPVPPTGRRVTYGGASFLSFADGRLVHTWSVNELFSVLQQLGVHVRPPTA